MLRQQQVQVIAIPTMTYTGCWGLTGIPTKQKPLSNGLPNRRRMACIVVLAAGKIVEKGKHEELLASKGVYHSMFTAQFEGTSDTVLSGV